MTSTLPDRNHGGVRSDPVGPDRPPPADTRIGEDRHEAIDHHRADLERIASKRTGDDEPTATAVRAQARLDDDDRYRQEIADMTATDIRAGLRTDSHGLATALEGLGWDVAYCSRSAVIWWRKKGGKWQPGDDNLVAWIRQQIADAFTVSGKPMRFGRDTWPGALGAVLHTRTVDMFEVWLDRLPAWDGHSRIDGWLSQCFEIVEHDPDSRDLAAWASGFLLLGAVERAREPGAKLDEMPVLVGPQGCGKSTALRWLLPQGAWGDRWFSDALNLSADNKVRAESLLGRVVVEVSEMTGATRAEVDSLKAFLSRTDDGAVRLAYRENPTPMQRRAIMAGTTNNVEALPNDVSGNRRFVVVEIASGNPTYLRQYLDANRDQMWAEACALYDGGARARLPEALSTAQADVNERHRRRDAILEDALGSFLALQVQPFPMADAAIATGLLHPADGPGKLSKRDQGRLAIALRAMGCTDTRRTVDGRKLRLWTTPNGPVDHPGPSFSAGVPPHLDF